MLRAAELTITKSTKSTHSKTNENICNVKMKSIQKLTMSSMQRNALTNLNNIKYIHNENSSNDIRARIVNATTTESFINCVNIINKSPYVKGEF